MSKLDFYIYEEDDDYNNIIQSQELTQVCDNYGITRTIYSVHSLTDCPEDAIIGRSLVSAEKVIDYIKYGMRLAAQGYTEDDIIVTYTSEDEDEDEDI